MRWMVVWIPSAEQKLARLWMRALDRASVRRAAFEIDKLLKIDPENVGESRPAGQRIIHIQPLGVRFKVSPADRLVQVVDVWWYGKRSDPD
jgi:hypothetical protein